MEGVFQWINDEEELGRKFKQTNDEDKKRQKKIKVQILAAV